MALKTRPTAFSRILFVLIIMAALFFGVQYALTSTDWGRELHQEIQQRTPDAD